MTNESYAEAELKRLNQVVERNNEILKGATLPIASDVRQETEIPDLSEEVIDELYRNMDEETGFGRIEDRTLAEAGMLGGAVVLEGGRVPIKLKAELELVLREEHGPIVFTGTRHRDLDKEEVALLGIEGTEFDAAGPLMELQSGYTPWSPKSLPFGYELKLIETPLENGKIHYSYAIEVTQGENATEDRQAVHMGWINDQPVCKLEVSRLYYTDINEADSSKQKKYFQPNPGELAELSAAMLEVSGASVDKIATITGGIYAPSRSMDIIKANQRLAKAGSSLIVGYATYGRQTASEVSGQPLASRPPLKQLISEVSRIEVIRSGER